MKPSPTRHPRPILPPPLASGIAVLLLLSVTTPTVEGQDRSAFHTAGICARADDPEPVTLSRLWASAREMEPGYRAWSELRLAEEEARSGIRREWAPTLAAEGLGNHGQRLSPGEERVLGVGPRGELRMVGAWTVLDLERNRRAEVARSREREAALAERVFDTGYRSLLAAAYVEAFAARELHAARARHRQVLGELEEVLRSRIEAGVEARWEVHLLDEARARSERLLAEADQARIRWRDELSVAAGRCVAPRHLDPDPTGPEDSGLQAPGEEVLLLERRAETRRAMAAEEAARGRLRLQLLGIVGPNYSRAFDDGRVEQEYLVGLSLAWRPDLSGVRGRLAAAESARARAAGAEAESLRLAQERELAGLRAVLAHAGERTEGLTSERAQAARREEAALLRWREGVDRWTEVLQARDRVLEVATLEVSLRREVALALIRMAEVTGTMDEVPSLLGQEKDR